MYIYVYIFLNDWISCGCVAPKRLLCVASQSLRRRPSVLLFICSLRSRRWKKTDFFQKENGVEKSFLHSQLFRNTVRRSGSVTAFLLTKPIPAELPGVPGQDTPSSTLYAQLRPCDVLRRSRTSWPNVSSTCDTPRCRPRKTSRRRRRSADSRCGPARPCPASCCA